MIMNSSSRKSWLSTKNLVPGRPRICSPSASPATGGVHHVPWAPGGAGEHLDGALRRSWRCTPAGIRQNSAPARGQPERRRLAEAEQFPAIEEICENGGL